MATLDHNTATIDELVSLCSSPSREIIGGAPHGNKVIKISDRAVIKFGLGVTEGEAENQRRAYDLLNPDVVRVPRVFRSFRKDLFGYIVMENIRGKIIDPMEDSDRIRSVARIISQFNYFQSSIPSSLGRGVSLGLLWPQNDDIFVNSVADLESFFNSRLSKKDDKLDFKGYKLILCHLDVAPRNIIWLEDGSVCFLDWASAGFYPRLFEICAQRILLGKEGNFNKILLDYLGALSYKEEAQATLIMKAFHNMQRFRFPTWEPPKQHITVPMEGGQILHNSCSALSANGHGS